MESVQPWYSLGKDGIFRQERGRFVTVTHAADIERLHGPYFLDAVRCMAPTWIEFADEQESQRNDAALASHYRKAVTA